MTRRNQRPSVTNKNLRIMAWTSFGVAIGLAIWGVASDGVVMAFLGKAAADLGLVTGRNMNEDIADAREAMSKNVVEAAKQTVDVSQI